KRGPRPAAPRVGELVAEENSDTGILKKATIEAFNARIQRLGRQVRERLDASRQRGGRALAYGSSVGCAALVPYFDLGKHLDAIFDDTPLANFIRTPAGALPVLSGSQLANELPTDVVVLAWRYMYNIGEKQTTFREKGGRFYRALPDLAFLES